MRERVRLMDGGYDKGGQGNKGNKGCKRESGAEKRGEDEEEDECRMIW